MDSLQPYALVRVAGLKRPPDTYDGWRINQRPPNIGDIGVIVEIVGASGLPPVYIVESVNADGSTIWLGEFTFDELVAVDEKKPLS